MYNTPLLDGAHFTKVSKAHMITLISVLCAVPHMTSLEPKSITFLSDGVEGSHQWIATIMEDIEKSMKQVDVEGDVWIVASVTSTHVSINVIGNKGRWRKHFPREWFAIVRY